MVAQYRLRQVPKRQRAGDNQPEVLSVWHRRYDLATGGRGLRQARRTFGISIEQFDQLLHYVDSKYLQWRLLARWKLGFVRAESMVVDRRTVVRIHQLGDW